MTILVADDDAAVRAVLEQTLTAAGYRTLAVSDGAAAVRACRTIAPDAIVLDIMMPKLNGWQVATALRALGCSAPIVFLSGEPAPTLDEHVRVEAAAFLHKPLAAADLLAELRRHIRRPVAPGRADRLSTVIA